jgi:threonine/homoserine/homoserine lactone efflux protein
MTQYEYHIPWDYRTFVQCLVGAVILGIIGCWLGDAPSLSAVSMKCAATLAYLGWLAILVKRNRGRTEAIACAGDMQPSEDLRVAGVANES